ncbi:winged helix-turn-helix transcriptional regulator [Promicromonospora sp. NPDC019610]|uniref:winged helix-turn-helix transcriptional regulator n=1 Tax=Promicromonospora sp. NPDC019610 TaxID=3364405 RepID=UPI0037BBCF4F
MTTPAASPAHTAWHDTDEAECRHASKLLEVVGQRWSPSILLALGRGVERFGEITAMTTGLSARMLTLRLKQLEAAQLVERIVIPTTPVTIRYRLTAQGQDLMDALHSVAGYVQRWKVDEPETGATALPPA